MAQTSNEGRGGAPRREDDRGNAPATGTDRPPQQVPEHRDPAPQHRQPSRGRDFAPGEDGECH